MWLALPRWVGKLLRDRIPLAQRVRQGKGRLNGPLDLIEHELEFTPGVRRPSPPPIRIARGKSSGCASDLKRLNLNFPVNRHSGAVAFRGSLRHPSPLRPPPMAMPTNMGGRGKLSTGNGEMADLLALEAPKRR